MNAFALSFELFCMHVTQTQVTFDLLQTRGMNNMSASIRNFSISSTRVNTLQDNSLKVCGDYL